MIDQLLRAGVVPIFSHESPDTSLAVLRAAYEGGVRVFEYTNRQAQALATFRQLAVVQQREMPDLLLGIGTVFEADTARQFIDAGARFVVAPVCDPAVGAVCQAHNVPWLPGCMTLTEILTARRAGAALIKVFPGEVVGPAFVRSVRSVMPDARLLVTGGVEPTRASLSTWLGAGAAGVGLGSQLFPKDVIAQHDMPAVTEKIRHVLQLYAEVTAS